MKQQKLIATFEQLQHVLIWCARNDASPTWLHLFPYTATYDSLTISRRPHSQVPYDGRVYCSGRNLPRFISGTSLLYSFQSIASDCKLTSLFTHERLEHRSKTPRAHTHHSLQLVHFSMATTTAQGRVRARPTLWPS